MTIVEEFNDYRAKIHENILEENNTGLQRLFHLDTNAFAQDAKEGKVKELIGLSSSMVLRCDDCIKYHLGKCHELGVTTKEVFEVFSIANLIGGTIVIPHLRRAVEFWEELNK